MSLAETMFAAELPRRNGADLEVVYGPRKRWSEGAGDVDVLAGSKRVGRIEGLRGGAPTFCSAGGAWSLRPQGSFGWNYSIVAPNGAEVGAFHGNRWLPGGQFAIAGGSATLGWRPPGRYLLRGARGGPFASIRRRRAKHGLGLQITLLGHAPAGIVFDVLILTASAVLLLEQYVVADGAPAGP